MRLSIIVFLFFTINLSAQYTSGVSMPDSTISMIVDESDLSVKYANTIQAADLKRHLDTLASDAFEGRETGTPGIDKAAEYLSNYFESLALPKIGDESTYFQGVQITFTRGASSELLVNGNRFKHLWDYLSFPDRNKDLPRFTTDKITFLGYGIDDPRYSDYRGVNVKDKVIMIYDGEPIDKDSISVITKSKQLSHWSNDWKNKLIAARNNGVKLVLIIEDDIKGELSRNRSKLLGGSMALGDESEFKKPYANSIAISSNIAKEIMSKDLAEVIKIRDQIKSTGKAKSKVLKAKLEFEQQITRKLLEGVNVLGFIEGSSKKEEIVVVSAHFDHVGKTGDDIFNGANDNASGTSTVLEIAEAFAEAKKNGHGPKRSILCLLVSGEEKGLLGSAYYTDKPIFPLENTVVDINVDMVGRSDIKYADDPDYIYVIGSDRLSTELHKINESANQKYTQLTLDYTYNAESDPNRYYFRSDHYNFAEKGIPAIFFFNGTHQDYHRPSDTAEKINFEQMKKTGQLIFHTAWELANREARIQVDVGTKKPKKISP